MPANALGAATSGTKKPAATTPATKQPAKKPAATPAPVKKKTIATVKKLRISSKTETSATLKWNRVSGATGYYIYKLNNAGKPVKIGSTKKTNYTVKKCIPGQKYIFQVCAYKKSKKTVILSQDLSNKATVATAVKTPGKPTGLRHSSSNDLSATVRWNTAKNASGYEIYMKTGAKGDFVKIATSKKTLYTRSRLKEGENYSFKLRSFRRVSGVTVYSGFSNTVTIQAKKLSNAVKKIRTAWYSSTLKSKYTTKSLKTGKTVTIKKGTAVTAKSRSGSVECILKNGDTVKIPASKLRTHSLITRKKAYSKSVQEDFVNSRMYSSPSKYLIWISQYTLHTSIFTGRQGHWKLIRCMPCCIGSVNGRTFVKVTKIFRKTWNYGAPSLAFSRWSTKHNSENAFHLHLDARRQAAVTGGCVRLTASNLLWMNSHIPVGTTVVSY